MYITREKHAATVRLVPAYVSEGHYKAMRNVKQKNIELEHQCSHHQMRVVAVFCISLCIGFIGGLLAYRWCGVAP